MDSIEILKQSILKMLTRYPFFAVMLLKHKIVYDNTCDTAYTNGVTLGICEVYYTFLTLGQRLTLLAHEVCHIILKHHLRRMGRDFDRWNRACDYAINLMLVEWGFEPLPIWEKDGIKYTWLYDTRYKGMSTEAIYRLLENEEAPKTPPPQPKPSDEQGEESDESGNDKSDTPSDEQGDGDGNGKGDTPSDEESDGDGAGDGDGEPSDAEGNGEGTGDGSNGKANTPQPIGEVRDAPNPTEASNAVDQSVQQAAALERRAGKGTMIGERILGIVPPCSDPREIVARFLTERADADYSYARPNKKVMGTTDGQLYAPSRYNKTLGRFAIAADTSGSCIGEIPKTVGFVLSVLESMIDYGAQHSIPVIYCDDAVQRVDEVSAGDDINPPMGGGTSFAPPFKYIEDSGENIIGLLYITDGWGPFPTEEPPYPVLWLLLVDSAHFKPPFGETVEIFNLL